MEGAYPLIPLPMRLWVISTLNTSEDVEKRLCELEDEYEQKIEQKWEQWGMIWEIRLNGGRNIYLGEWVIVKQMVNIIRTRWGTDIPPGPSSRISWHIKNLFHNMIYIAQNTRNVIILIKMYHQKGSLST